MERMKTLLSVAALVLLLLIGAAPAHAQVNAGVLFLRIAAGARAAGMGEAFVAIDNDATATHWNPAGLGAYPLNSEWSEHPLFSKGTVLDAVALKNGLPYTDFSGYDLWILTDQGLLVFRPGVHDKLAASVELPTTDVGSVGAAIRRYAPFLTEDDADAIARQSTGAKVRIPQAEMEALLARVSSSIPPDYRDRTIVENVARDFRAAYFEGRLESDRLADVRAALGALPDSGAADIVLLDRARFTMEHTISQVIPNEIRVNLADLIHPPIRAIACDGDNLYVAARDGLLVFDGDRWDLLPPPAGSDWATTGVNALAVTSGRRVWAGTDAGLWLRNAGQWQKMGEAEGLPSERVTKIAFANSKSGWVLTDAGLAYYDGAHFSANAKVTANIGDSLAGIVRRFVDNEDAVTIAAAVETVRKANNVKADFVPEAGSEINVPYQLGIRGQITTLAMDSYDRLWVGTTVGALRFSKGHWSSFGYEPLVVPQATTAAALAESRLGSRATPERLERLAGYITAYNNLAEGQIEAGRQVYVYRNPAGSQVLDMAGHGDQLFVATEVGQLEVKSGEWARYYHNGLDQDQVRAIVSEGSDVWFVTDNRVIVYQHPHKELSLMHANWLPEFNLDLYYEYFSYVTNVEGIGTLGGAITFLSYGEIPRTDERGGSLNSFHSFDGAFALSYGTRINPHLAAGMTAKIIYSRLADQGAGSEIGSGSATAFAMDAGFLYRTPWRRLTLGGALTNVGPNISYIDAQQSDPLPRNLALGLAYRVLSSPYNKLTLIGELNKEVVSLKGGGTSELKQVVYNGGLEYWYASYFAARAGYIYDQTGHIKTLTVGAGLSYQRLQMDFAYIPASKDLPLANTLRVSMTGRF
ncbi:MAG: PorV/PorQ family protein [candidate division Zixibacteria bacterium]|nr:PorV/PorQ family protein [candidate division Zixibacteria bacterium]